MLLGRGLMIVVQAVYFILLARALGATQYGAFVGAVAIATILSPFSTLGSGNLLIKHVARNRSAFRQSWGDALITSFVSGGALTFLGVIAASIVLPNSISWKLVLPIAVAELVCGRTIEVASHAFLAIEDVRMSSTVLVALSTCRMLAAGALMLVYDHASALNWAVLYLISSAIPCIGAIITVSSMVGMPVFAYSLRWSELREGFYFAISYSAQTIYNDIDKIMLVRLVGLQPAGIYGAAYRIVNVACAPIGALVYAAYPRFFQHGHQGLDACLRFARKLVARSAAFGLVGALGLFFGAPLLVPIIGRQYAESVEALRWLAPIVLFRSIHYFAADTLTGSDHQGLRSLIQVSVAVVNVALNWVILPRYSWRGAAWTSIFSDGVLLLALCAAVLILARSSRRRSSLGSATDPDSLMEDATASPQRLGLVKIASEGDDVG